MTSGKRAIKNNERNYPVENSIRLRKEATAPTAAEFDTSEFQVGEEVWTPTDNEAWRVSEVNESGTWIEVTNGVQRRVYRWDQLKRVSEKA